MRRPPLIFSWLLVGLIAAALRAAEPSDAINLPPFIVEEASQGPPWRYGEVPGFEILSRCPDDTTRDLVEAYFRLHRLLELLLPERLQLAFALPKVLIFYDEALQPAASQEVIASMLRRANEAGPPADWPANEPGRFGGRGAFSMPPRRMSFVPNLRLWDKDQMTVFAIVRNSGYDGDRLVLTGDYVNYLLLNRVPALPGWFVSGVLRLYERTDYEIDALALRPITWISEELTDALRRDPKSVPAPLPLAEFLSTLPPLHPATPAEELRRKVWLAQSALFVRWALDGRDAGRREAFWAFVDHAGGGGTPALFQKCFGIDFATADAQLAAYLPAAVRKTLTLRPARPLKPPKLALRNGTELELACLKGDWERLEVALVRKQTPELAGKYLEQARRTLRHAYDRELRDPRLLAAMGLCEVDAGDDATAREWLESAARLGPLRPRAGYELARLRFAEADANPAAEGRKFSAAQAAQVLSPLFAVRDQPPPLVEIYELIAKVWARVAFKPTRGHLAVLDDGVRLFPRRGPLIHQTALLYADNGFTADAAELVRLGLFVAADDAERERFTQLGARLAEAPAVK